MCSICSPHTRWASSIKLETRIIREKGGQCGKTRPIRKRSANTRFSQSETRKNSALYEILNFRQFGRHFEVVCLVLVQNLNLKNIL